MTERAPTPGLTAALGELLRLEGHVLDSPDMPTMLRRVEQSRWLRFALGIRATEPFPPDDEAGLERAAREFVDAHATFTAYRTCAIEIRPPGLAPVRFRIGADDPQAPPPPSFPAATLAIITAWNPGATGEPRFDERPNRRANARLAAHLDARLVERWPAVNAPGSRWQEESFAILGLDLDEAFRIGESFQQRGIYYIDAGRPLLVSRRRGQVVTWEGRITL